MNNYLKNELNFQLKRHVSFLEYILFKMKKALRKENFHVYTDLMNLYRDIEAEHNICERKQHKLK